MIRDQKIVLRREVGNWKIAWRVMLDIGNQQFGIDEIQGIILQVRHTLLSNPPALPDQQHVPKTVTLEFDLCIKPWLDGHLQVSLQYDMFRRLFVVIIATISMLSLCTKTWLSDIFWQCLYSLSILYVNWTKKTDHTTITLSERMNIVKRQWLFCIAPT